MALVKHFQGMVAIKPKTVISNNESFNYFVAQRSWGLGLNPKDNTNVLANTFHAKSQLPPRISVLKPNVKSTAKQMPEFTLIWSGLIRRIIKSLKLNTASALYGVQTLLFRYCCHELVPVIAVLMGLLILILFFMKSRDSIKYNISTTQIIVSASSNYRGVHLTNILAKIAERAFASVLAQHFDKADAF